MTPHEVTVHLRGSTASELVTSARSLIGTGRLTPGTVLPAIRTLATALGVNRNTVAAAYAQLAAAGLVEARGRAGTIVLGLTAVDGEGRAASASLVNLAGGNPDPAFLPRPGRAVDPAFVPPLYGADPITPELAHWAARHLSPDVTGEHRLVLTNGSVDAVERLLTAHLTRGDLVALEDPCFLSSIGLLRLGGYRSVAVPVDAEGMTPAGLRAALEGGARAVVITPRAHNPTGASLTPARAAQLRAILTSHPEVLVVEDDHFWAVSGRPYLRVTPPEAPRWALVRTVSKSLGTNLRLAFVLADPETARRLEARLSAAVTWVSHVLQHITARLLVDAEVTATMERARTAYARRSRLLVEALRAHGIACQEPVDGLNVWVPTALPSAVVVRELAARGWAVRAGDDFAVDQVPRAALRVTSSTITAEEATAFAASLAAVLRGGGA